MAKASGVDLESGSGRVTQWTYEGRLTTASDRDVDCVDREIRDMSECTESVSEADEGNG